MNKADLIEAVAIKCDISKLAAQRAVDAMIDTITNALQNGKEVQLLGFGTFSVVERAARKGAIFGQINQLIFRPVKFRSLLLAKI